MPRMRRDIRLYINNLKDKRTAAANAKKLQMWAFYDLMVQVLTTAFSGLTTTRRALEICRDINPTAITLCPHIHDARFAADLWAAGVHARNLMPRFGGYVSRPTLCWLRKRAKLPPKENDQWLHRIRRYPSS